MSKKNTSDNNLVIKKNNTFNISLFSNINILIKKNPLLKKRINKMQKHIEDSGIGEKIENIQEPSQILDIQELLKQSCLTNNEICDYIIENNIIDQMINTPEKNERIKILDNIKFLEESNHDEKTFLIWIYLIHLINSKENLFAFQKNYKNIREKYHLKTHYIPFENIFIFNKYNAINQLNLLCPIFSQDYWDRKNIEIILDRTYEEIYEIFPEIKLMFTSKEEHKNILGVELKHMFTFTKYLDLAAQILLSELGIK